MKVITDLIFLSTLFTSSVRAQLKVLQPSTLVAAMPDGAGTVEASLGNFGHIMYGQTLIGTVVHPTASWEAPSSVSSIYGCAPLNWGDFP